MAHRFSDQPHQCSELWSWPGKVKRHGATERLKKSGMVLDTTTVNRILWRKWLLYLRFWSLILMMTEALFICPWAALCLPESFLDTRESPGRYSRLIKMCIFFGICFFCSWLVLQLVYSVAAPGNVQKRLGTDQSVKMEVQSKRHRDFEIATRHKIDISWQNLFKSVSWNKYRSHPITHGHLIHIYENFSKDYL